jgi:hypothetical protein
MTLNVGSPWSGFGFGAFGSPGVAPPTFFSPGAGSLPGVGVELSPVPVPVPGFF